MCGCKEDPEGEYRSVKGGKWGYINKQGKIVIPAQFEEAGDFENGKAEVKFNSKRVFIDKRGRIIKGSISGMEKEEKQSIGSARMEDRWHDRSATAGRITRRDNRGCTVPISA